MAEPLSSARASNISQATYLEFVDKYADADDAVAEAVAARKDLRAKIKSAGIPLQAFDRSRRDAAKSGELREAEEFWYRRMMGWLKKPVGFQAEMDLPADTDPGIVALNASELKRIDAEGFAAGKGGDRADRNSYTPGTEAYARFHKSWIRGQAEIASTMSDAQPKRRGRPPKSAVPAPADLEARRVGRQDGLAGNRDHAARYASGEAGHGDYEFGHADGGRERRATAGDDEPGNGAEPSPRRRGRPAGSRNRPKEQTLPLDVEKQPEATQH